MGHYSVLNIGDEELFWKYEIPEFLCFLFDEDELVKNYDDEEQYYETIGYQTSCEKAINKLENLGFNWELFLRVYDNFYDELVSSYLDNLKDYLDEKFNNSTTKRLNSEFSKYFNSLNILSRKDQLRDYAKFLGAIFRVCNGGKTEKIKSLNGKNYTLNPLLDKDKNPILTDPHSFIYNNFLSLPSWICVISGLFEDEYINKFNEIISLLQIKFLLHSYEPTDKVSLELNDIIEEESELYNFHNDAATKIINKINLYNDFFNSIVQQKDFVKEIYLKQKLSKDILKISSLSNNDKYSKGIILEEIMVDIIDSIEGLDIVEKRMDTGDEEIDIVAKNNINNTFWQSFGSPLIFFECKNWKTNIGSREIRDFELKVQNHNKMVKIGIFISFNGFTKEVFNELKRNSRSDYHIALISKDDIEVLISSNIKVLDWLESLITKLY